MPLPDFRGTWTFEKDSVSPGLVVAFTSKRQDELIIVQNDVEIKVKHNLTLGNEASIFEKTYYTDGRGETNLFADDDQYVVETTTKLKKQILIIKGCLRKVGAKEGKCSIYNRWKLSKDNKTLTIESQTFFWRGLKNDNTDVAISAIYKLQ